MAKLRKIAWEFTYESWWEVWESSGKWEQRGRGKGKYVMSRIGDIGPYSPSNVFIQLNELNVSQGVKGKKQDPELIAKRVSKIKGVKHSPERRLANSLGQLNGRNVFVLRRKQQVI